MNHESIADAIEGFTQFAEPQIDLGPFRLACEIGPPATSGEIAAAMDEAPPELIDLWSVAGSARLFVDIDYGQWGLELLSPRDSADVTRHEVEQRPGEYLPDDVVIGQFLGDLELLVYSPSEPTARRILVSLPLDKRADWPVAGSSIVEFLLRFTTARGDKFWEPTGS